MRQHTLLTARPFLIDWRFALLYVLWIYIVSQFKLRTARIAPIKKYEESAIKDSVYNHLNESDKVERSDYYDHAGPAPSISVIEDGYGVVSMKSESKSEGNGDYNTVGRNNNAGKKQNDNYFILEVQED